MSGTRAMLIYPYSGLKFDERDTFVNLVDACFDNNKGIHTRKNRKPILVVNRDTVRRPNNTDKDFIEEEYEKGRRGQTKLDVVYSSACDTCMMWLDGYSKALADDASNMRQWRSLSVIQIAGDVRSVRNFDDFVRGLSSLAAQVERNNRLDFALGDFNVTRFSAKELIDTDGTYKLFYNWFRDIAFDCLQGKLELKRPRTEFFAATYEFLNEMLRRRKFAYELTMAFLIYAFQDKQKAPRGKKKDWKIDKVELGEVVDYAQGRGFREAIDQIERTERMLKLIWRESNGGNDFDVREFLHLDRRSTSIRDAAMVSWENVLKPTPPPAAKPSGKRARRKAKSASAPQKSK